MTKAQLAMWTLTKMAMLFFIIALALVIMSFAGREKQALCTNRAQAVANSVGSALAQVISSPLEDERIVHPLEAVLTVGKSDYERYSITLTQHVENPDEPFFVIEVNTTSPSCKGGTRVGYPKDLNVEFHQPVSGGIKIGTQTFQGMLFTPSTPDVNPSDPVRSKYITIIRCQKKTWPPTRSLFIQDCKQKDANSCENFNDEGDIKDACEWN